MESLLNERTERIVDLVEWFKEFQPNDLEQIERIMLGFRYVDNKVMESELRKDIYSKIHNTKLEKYLNIDYDFIDAMFRKDVNERIENK
ncbi:MAG: hypothetical protein ACRCXT_06625 [Paraclostridium sp.]